MVRFRRLSIDELKSLEKEFVDFLVLNGITGDDWLKLKEKQPESAEGVLDAFSDVILIKVLKQARYLEKVSPRHILTIFCDKERMFLCGLEAPTNVEVDFLKEKDFERLKNGNVEGIQKLTSEKTYESNREDEIWKLIQSGYSISNHRLYSLLANVNNE